MTVQERAPAWRGGFGRLWTAAVVSRFGDASRTSALPLPAARLTDDSLAIASVTACGYVPWPLLGGAVADREDRRRAMWAVDTVRGLLVAAFARAVVLGHALVPLLLLLAFALTTLQTLSDNASTAVLSSLVLIGSVRHLGALVTGRLLLGAMKHGVDRQPGHADAATRTRVDDRPDRRRLPHLLDVRRAARRRPVRPGRHLVDTGAQAGRTCCCAAGRRDSRPRPTLIN